MLFIPGNGQLFSMLFIPGNSQLVSVKSTARGAVSSLLYSRETLFHEIDFRKTVNSAIEVCSDVIQLNRNSRLYLRLHVGGEGTSMAYTLIL